jgi:hypothetical protein
MASRLGTRGYVTIGQRRGLHWSPFLEISVNVTIPQQRGGCVGQTLAAADGKARQAPPEGCVTRAEQKLQRQIETVVHVEYPSGRAWNPHHTRVPGGSDARCLRMDDRWKQRWWEWRWVTTGGSGEHLSLQDSGITRAVPVDQRRSEER